MKEKTNLRISIHEYALLLWLMPDSSSAGAIIADFAATALCLLDFVQNVCVEFAPFVAPDNQLFRVPFFCLKNVDFF
jgi:hypothetical protein